MRWTLFAAALLGWLSYFYAVDMLMMEAQELPVDATLMPQE